MATNDAVNHDITLLINHIKRIGNDTDGTYTTSFGDLFADDDVQNTLESLAGTLKAAKKRKIVSYKAELLLQGMSNNEVITLIKQDVE